MNSNGLDIGAAPLAKAALSGRMRFVVSERPLSLHSEERTLLSEGAAVGVIKVGAPAMVSAEELDALAEQTLITEEVRKSVWPNQREFWVYPIERIEGYQTVKAVDYERNGLLVKGLAESTSAQSRAFAALALVELGSSPQNVVEKQRPVEETKSSLLSKQRDASDFIRLDFVVVSEEPKVMAAIGKLKSDPDGAGKVQRFVLNKDAGWTLAKATEWLQRNRRKAVAFVEKRGLPTHDPEGGMHAHAARRANNRTAIDGGHRHLYLIGGELVVTQEDGQHDHEIDPNGNDTTEGGKHWHTLFLPEGNQLATGDAASKHKHVMMVLSTGLDGPHQHSLDINGETIMSLTPADFARLFPQIGQLEPPPIRTASEVLEHDPHF